MAYGVQIQINTVWVPDGGGGMTQAISQKLAFFPSGSSATGLPTTGMAQIVPVPGGDAPTAANFNTAIASAVADIEAQIAVAATLARIQGFASGTG